MVLCQGKVVHRVPLSAQPPPLLPQPLNAHRTPRNSQPPLCKVQVAPPVLPHLLLSLVVVAVVVHLEEVLHHQVLQEVRLLPLVLVARAVQVLLPPFHRLPSRQLYLPAVQPLPMHSRQLILVL